MTELWSSGGSEHRSTPIVMDIPLLSAKELPGRVAVVTGGWSRERDRSLLSAAAVLASLERQQIPAVQLQLDDLEFVEHIQKHVVVFLAIAGNYAEDGRLQGFLDTLRIPYNGSGVFASAAAMHKPAAKGLVGLAGVRVAEHVCLGCSASFEQNLEAVCQQLGLPVILKPESEGGSIDLHLVSSVEDLGLALSKMSGNNQPEMSGNNQSGMSGKNQQIMAERYHHGRSLTVGVLETEHGELVALPALETRTDDGVYTYEAKRRPGRCDYMCPADVPGPVAAQLSDAAEQAHRALGCHGYSRSDFVVTEDGAVFWLEVNTLPGLSRTGNLARMAAAADISHEQLIAHILRTAFTVPHRAA